MSKFAVKFRKIIDVEAIVEADTEEGAKELIFRGDFQDRCSTYREEEEETEIFEITDLGKSPSIFDIEEDELELYYD